MFQTCYQSSLPENLISEARNLFEGRNLRKEWGERFGPKECPPTIILDHVKVNIGDLASFYQDHSRLSHNKTTYEGVIREALGYDLPKGYWPLDLTSFPKHVCLLQDKIDNWRGCSWKEHQQKLNPIERIRSLMNIDENYDPIIDERLCCINPSYAFSYVDNLVKQFKARVCRVRFVKLEPGERLKPHIDCDTRYNLRAHIPLYTNLSAYNSYLDPKTGHEISEHLEVGKVYLLNAGITHWATNNGNTPRVHLVVGLDGQEDYTGVNYVAYRDREKLCGGA
jgi:hypothetical protein